MSYADYLMHFRTAGAKNGETKYPGKYKPIGQKARGIEEAATKTSLSRMYDQNTPQQTPEQLKSLKALRMSGYKGPIPDYLKPNYQEKTADQEISDALKPTQQDLQKKAEEKVDKEFKTGRINKKPGATSRYLDKVEKKKRLKQLIEQKRKELVEQEVMNEMTNQNAKHGNSTDYLIHYRTAGSKNGFTKYPDKYKPVGEKASNKKFNPIGDLISSGREKLKEIGNKVEDRVTKGLTVNLGPSEIRKEITGRVNNKVDSAVNRIQRNNPRVASTEDSFKEFMANDIYDRLNDKINKGVRKTGDYIKNTTNRMVNDERFTEEMRKHLKNNYKDTNNIESDIIKSLADSKTRKKYTNIALDAAIPTYKGSKASTEDSFKDFIKNDLRDRANENTKELKSKVSSKINEAVDRFVNDERVKSDLSTFKDDPYGTIEKFKDPKNKERNVETALDAAIPTYDKSKSSTEDSMKKFIKNDIKDRTNNMKKKLKKMIKFKIT